MMTKSVIPKNNSRQVLILSFFVLDGDDELGDSGMDLLAV